MTLKVPVCVNVCVCVCVCMRARHTESRRVVVSGERLAGLVAYRLSELVGKVAGLLWGSMPS